MDNLRKQFPLQFAILDMIKGGDEDGNVKATSKSRRREKSTVLSVPRTVGTVSARVKRNPKSR